VRNNKMREGNQGVFFSKMLNANIRDTQNVMLCAIIGGVSPSVSCIHDLFLNYSLTSLFY
jgi:hypothetical protein